MTPDHQKARWANGFAAAAIALWCWSAPCFAKGAAGFGAMPYLAISCAIGVPTAMTWHRLQGGKIADLFLLPKRVIVTGFFGMSVYTTILVMAVGMAPESDLAQVALINYLWPVFMVLLSLALLPDKPRLGLVLLGALLGFVGVVVVKGTDSFTRPPATLLPHLMALIGAVMWAGYSVLLKRWQIPENKSGSTMGFALCGVLAAIVAAINGEWTLVTASSFKAIGWAIFLGIGPIGLAYHWWEIGIKRGNPHLIALLAYFTPVGSALLIALLFREALSWGLFPGAALITLGACLGQRAMAVRPNTTAASPAAREGDDTRECAAASDS